jgi:hypothetical protein
MSHITELERSIVVALILKPGLIEVADGLSSRCFSEGPNRRLYSAIVDFCEESRPDRIDELLLSEKSGIPLAKIQELQAGCYVPSSDNFLLWTKELQEQQYIRRLIPLIDKQTRMLVRTGEYDPLMFDEIRQELRGLDNLLQSPKDKRLLSIEVSTICPEPVSWLWPNYFPCAKLSLLSGDPGCGKTWLSLDIAARLSTGNPWPDHSQNGLKGNTLILSCEDGASDTFRPRLDRLGADLSRIFLLQEPLDLSTEQGRALLASEVEQRKPHLIIIDPVFDYSGNVNPNAVEKVRAMLTPLGALAEQSRAAVLLTSHLNKSSTMQAIYRTSGSASGWIGKARAAFLILRDEEDLGYCGRQRRILAPVKTNLSPMEPKPLYFLISENAGLEFEPVPEDFSLDEHLMAKGHHGAPQLDEAKKFVKETLKNGPIEASEILEQAQRAGIAQKTINRAKKDLGIIPTREGGTHGRWMWDLGQRIQPS